MKTALWAETHFVTVTWLSAFSPSMFGAYDMRFIRPNLADFSRVYVKDDGTCSARALTPPTITITDKDYDALAEAYRICEMRNLPRSRALYTPRTGKTAVRMSLERGGPFSYGIRWHGIELTGADAIQNAKAMP